MATDPVCHMEVDEATALTADVDGHRYYFCSEQCREAFVGEPDLPEESQQPTAGYPTER
ncbi:MAG TPA: YHS domain-containing protein [Pirellulales bacterium]|nr:YHS domain-containing protein [Pirellulales bacterium]